MYHVLLVDDEPYITEGLAAIIDWSATGMEVAARAASAREALEVIDRADPVIDMVVTDIRMPEHDGLWLIEQVRLRGTTLPVVVLSAYDDFALVQRCFPLGVVNYLLKPVDVEELSSTVAEVQEKLDAARIEVNGEEILELTLLRHVHGTISPREFAERIALIAPPLVSAEPALAMWIDIAPIEHDQEHSLEAIEWLTNRYRGDGAWAVRDHDRVVWALYDPARMPADLLARELATASGAPATVVCIADDRALPVATVAARAARLRALLPVAYSLPAGSVRSLAEVELVASGTAPANPTDGSGGAPGP